jgi:spore coat polysaccharide biosynthesis protein SpsF
MTTAIIIQARMASTRLPGKVLLDLNGRSVLSHVIERCQAVKNADVVCCAIPDNTESDPVALEAENCGSVVYRGSEQDVLDRYFQAAKWLKADIVLRVTSDCPMIDPDVCDAVLNRRAVEDADYATNNMPPSWPHGLDCEAIKFKWLKRAWLESTEPQDREHVTPFIRRNKKAHKVNVEGPGGSLLEHRWTLDYPEDLEFMQALFAKLPEHPVPTMTQMHQILGAHPEISAINNMHHSVSHDPDSIPVHDAKRYAVVKDS